MTEKDATGQLQKAGLRLTTDRLKLLSLLDRRRAWTADQLHAELPNIDLSTVYRNLTALTDSGILQTSPTRDGKTAYELNGSKHHAHSVCRGCGRISCVPCPLEEKSSDEHSLELYRSCRGCRTSASK